MAAVLAGSVILGVIFLICDGKAGGKPVTEITRKDYGQGSVIRELQVILDGVQQEESIRVKVQEKNYSDQELQEIFQKEAKSLEKRILGKNVSLDQVQYDLDLITEIPGQPIRVEWEVSRYDLISTQGVLQAEALESEMGGVLVQLNACLIYKQDETKRTITEMTARLYPPAIGGTEESAQLISDEIQRQEETSREESVFYLPEEIGGKELQLYQGKSHRGWYVMLMGPMICVLLVLQEKQEQQEKQKEKQEQMMRDYPEITEKLTLLLGAGMTVKNAWQKIVTDYEKQKESRGRRWAYEEMLIVCREMQSGVTEMEAYEQFGRRCEVKAYRKLAALLAQNLRKGTKGLSELLRTESEQAFEERKACAKKRGEEAGTKLLLPMLLMLMTVLIVVIVPAFKSIQM